MKLFIAEINKNNDEYRVLDTKNHSHYKGTKKECQAFINIKKPHDEPTGNISMPSEYRYNPMYK